MYQLSKFARDPRERDAATEIEDFRDYLQVLQEEFAVPIYYKYGNHEERFDTYIYTHAKEFAGLDSQTAVARAHYLYATGQIKLTSAS